MSPTSGDTTFNELSVQVFIDLRLLDNSISHLEALVEVALHETRLLYGTGPNLLLLYQAVGVIRENLPIVKNNLKERKRHQESDSWYQSWLGTIHMAMARPFFLFAHSPHSRPCLLNLCLSVLLF